MDTFLETCNLPTLNHDETENVSRPNTSKETKLVIKHLTANKSPGPDGFIDEICQTFKELIPVLLKLFQKIAE